MSDVAFQEDEYHRQLDLALWRRVLRHARPYRRPLLGLSVAALVVATVEVFFPLATGWLIDEAVANGVSGRLYALAGFYFALCLLLSVCIFAFISFAGRVATGVAFDLREQAFTRLQQLSFAYFDVRPVGWLVTRVTADVSKISSLLPWFLLDLVWGGSLILGIAVAMLWINWPLALIVLAIMPPISLISVFFQRRMLGSSRLIRKTNSQMTAAFNEAITGVRTTKTLVREDEALREFQGLSSGMFQHCMRNALQSAAYLPMVMSLGSLGVGLVLWRGGVTLGSAEGSMTLGTLIAFMQFAAFLHMPVEELARRFTDLQSAQAAAERVQSLLDTEPAIADSPAVCARLAAHSADAPRDDVAIDGFSPRIERIAFRDVGFWYKAGEPVLQHFDLEVRMGQTIALVGATGGGKSTIVSLLARFYEPTEGRIEVDGVEYRERALEWWQSNFGIVLQSPVLFSGSVRENIRYGRLDATDEEVEAAARLVNAHGFISELAEGYDFDVGERGNRLSTGQRQLISLARAVIADPQVFILDEATSSVDTETERLIQDGVHRVLEGRLSFVIAHRLSTIRAADLILVIDAGRVVEQGTHAELMARRGRYHALYVGQFTRQREQAWLAGDATPSKSELR